MGLEEEGKILDVPPVRLLRLGQSRCLPPLSANLPDESITPIASVAKTGVYYGYAQVIPRPASETTNGSSPTGKIDTRVLPMVMSLGWNPFYKNKKLTAVRYLVFFRLTRMLTGSL